MSGALLGLLLLALSSALFVWRHERPRPPELPAASELPGADPSRAISVESPIVIDRYAERWPCPVCGSDVHCEPHQVRHIAQRRYRVAEPRCRRCGFTRAVYFELRQPDRPT